MAYKVFSNGSVLNASELNDFLMNQSVITFANQEDRLAAIPTPLEGMVTYLRNYNSYQYWNGSRWAGLFPQSQNFIINGAFDVWQRGGSITQTAPQYTADMWRMSADTAIPTLRTVTREAFSPNELPINNFGNSNFYLRSTLTTIGSSTAISLNNRIEDVRTLAGETLPFGQSATLSFWAKSDSNRTQTVDMRQNFGTGGSAQVTFGTNTFLTTDKWQRFVFTFEVPSMFGKTIGANSWMGPNFLQAFAAGSVLDLWGVQLEAGTGATPFRRNANSIQGELAACQRYYYRISTPAGNGSLWPLGTTESSTVLTAPNQNPVVMRVAPTSVEFANLRTWDGAGVNNVTNVVFAESHPNFTSLTFTVASGLTQFRSARILSSGASAGFIGISAEL